MPIALISHLIMAGFSSCLTPKKFGVKIKISRGRSTVLTRPLHAQNFYIGKLRAVVAEAEGDDRQDLRNQSEAESRLELACDAYADLTMGMEELVAATADLKKSLGIALAATNALEDYQGRQQFRQSKYGTTTRMSSGSI